LDNGAQRTVHVLQLGNKFGRELSVAITDQSYVAHETRKFPRLSDRLTTKCVSFSDKALNGARHGEGQAHILIGIPLDDLIVGLVGRVAHKLMLSRSPKLFSPVTTFTRKFANQ